jgi:exodeoxyribonuclease VII, small subunit
LQTVKNEMSFEEAQEKIEQIIQDMEQGNLPLEESVSRFEEAAALLKYCQRKLDSYQKKIETITLETDDINE